MVLTYDKLLEFISMSLTGKICHCVLWIKWSIYYFYADQPCKHMNISQYLMTNVLSLKEFTEPTPKEGISILKAISLAMVLLQRCEFKLNHEAWFNTVKHRIGVRNSSQVLAVVNATQDNIKSLYKVRAEMRSALNSHLKIF